MLYYDEKIQILENLAKEIKSMLETAQTSLNQSAIRSALQNNFSSLEADLEADIATQLSAAKSEVAQSNSTLESALKAQITEALNNAVKNEITNDRLLGIIDVDAISNEVSSSLLNARFDDLVTNILPRIDVSSLSGELITRLDTLNLQSQVSASLSATFEPIISDYLTSRVNGIINDSEMAQKVAKAFVDDLDARALIARILRAKINYDDEFKALLKSTCENLLVDLREERLLYLKDLIKKTQIYASQNMLAISNAWHLAQNEFLATLEFEFEKALAQRREEFYANLPSVDNGIVNNVLVVK